MGIRRSQRLRRRLLRSRRLAFGLSRPHSSSVFSSVDAGSYRDVADWIFGVRANPHASIQRPVFYPLILGLAMRVGDEYGVWLVNVALWFAALNLAGIAAYRFVHQMWATIVVFVVMATNV